MREPHLSEVYSWAFTGPSERSCTGITFHLHFYITGGPLCSITPRSDHGALSEDSGAEIELRDSNGNAVTEYVPGNTYTYWVSAPGSGTYKGFTVVVNAGA